MKVIDLLNKIANGEEVPKKIKVYQKICTLDKDSMNYMCGGDDWLAFIDGNELNYEIEIIEEDKKIEKIGIINYSESPVEAILHKKIDEIIDKLNEDKNE